MLAKIRLTNPDVGGDGVKLALDEPTVAAINAAIANAPVIKQVYKDDHYVEVTTDKHVQIAIVTTIELQVS